MATDNLLAELLYRGVSRRDFLKFCSASAAVLGLSSSYVPQIAHALETKKKPILVWIEC
jgi:hydrogenase small subunit